jgi:GMP synthase-like glutamine amidotransferase
MARILRVQHWKAEYAYNDKAFLAARGDVAEDLLLFDGEKAPNPSLYDLVIVYGGQMSAYDDAAHPWIARELRFLEACLAAGTKVLAICLGSQLVARLLGARIYPSPAPEFGFKLITLNEAGKADPVLGPLAGPDGRFLSIEWHDDAWDLPAGAQLLAASEAWPNQAFRYGPDVLALQFHLEFTQEHMAWAVANPDESESKDPEREDRTSFASPSPRYDEVRSSMERLLSSIFKSADQRRD